MHKKNSSQNRHYPPPLQSDGRANVRQKTELDWWAAARDRRVFRPLPNTLARPLSLHGRRPLDRLFTQSSLGQHGGGSAHGGVKGEVKGWGLSRRKREESWRDAIRNPMSLLNYLQKKSAKSSLFFFLFQDHRCQVRPQHPRLRLRATQEELCQVQMEGKRRKDGFLLLFYFSIPSLKSSKVCAICLVAVVVGLWSN